MQKAKPATLKAFYYRHGSRSAKLLEQRLALIEKAVPVTDETAGIGSFALRVQRLARQLQAVVRTIAEFDRQIAAAYAAHPDHGIFASLPGAGPVLGPRLLASLGADRERFAGSGRIHRRYCCPKFHRQSFHEYARESIRWSRWAGAFYRQQRSKGCPHHTAVRALAFKWQRVIWRCWQDRRPYDEARYEAALRRAGSPVVALFDRVDLGKSPCKHPAKKS
ncbi:MAG: hypothetical protein BWX84_02743 [Verrucomicrobia bacterium ADurb.Bin118]|nr:MAG: hypothetical protein BWX84_02743 [Verrucomicrobia bacterium ADurb.Bin118]